MPTSTRKPTVVNGGLAVLLIAGVALAATSVGAPAQAKSTPVTSPVQRGTVSTTVTATGNVQPASNLAVNFKTGGQLVEVDVTPGQAVTAGQTLAKVDTTTATANLLSAQANLTAAQGKLTQLQAGLTSAAQAQNAASLTQSQAQVNAATVSLGDSQRQAALDATLNASAVTVAKQQLATDQTALTQAQTALTDAKVNDPSCQSQTCQAASQAASAAQAAVTKDAAQIISAQNAQTSGALKDQQTLHQAQASLTNAQAGLAATQAGNAVKAQPPLPGDLASAQAAVVQAQATVTADQQAVTDCTLVAPVAGTVATVSAAVGATVGSSGGTSSSSSGSSSSTGGAASGSSGTASSSSTSGFIVLTDLSHLQVQAGFTEGDAAKLKIGQPATVTVAALPGQQLGATVSEIDTLQTVVSNVVTYNALLSLNDTVAGLKPGMTANVAVIVSQKDNVLHVPTAAVTGRGGNATVTVMNGKSTQTVSVITGLAGDSSTEILTGVTAGQMVVVSSGRTGSTGATARTGTGAVTPGLGGAGAGLGGGGAFTGGGARAGG